MALAKYFSKDLLAINRLINTDPSILEDILNQTSVIIAFDTNAVETFEGKCGLDLIVRLISRLYPRIRIIDLSGKNEANKDQLLGLAKAINSKIEILPENSDESIFIVAGNTTFKTETTGRTIYFGSDNWISKYSISTIQSFGDSRNPIGSGISACIVASNIFRLVFNKIIDYKLIDEEFKFSTFSLENNSKENPRFEEKIFCEATIVGVGAIGNGVVWALSQIEELTGSISLIDGETISLSNLQRYVLFVEEDEKKEKVTTAEQFFKTQNNLKIESHVGNWSNYIEKRGDWEIKSVAVGIDNERDRIGIQSSLPCTILNAFTEVESIGITRHFDFINDPCLACSYIPITRRKNRTVEIAENCRIPDKVDLVKDYYNYNSPVNELIPNYPLSLLQEISVANGIELDKLSQYNGLTVDQFYSDFICGGTILRLTSTKEEVKDVDAPLAFQSAMAGILLAAELIKYFNYKDIKQENRTDIYHLSPISNLNPFHRQLIKDKTMRCLCQDEDFKRRYIEKWKS
jgi:hypothetical protein